MTAKRTNIFAIGCYCLLAVALGCALRDYVYSIDNLLYLNIARKYAAGKLPEAVNFYWSPLISWLCVPVLPFFQDPLHAFKVVQLGLGLVALRYAQKLVAATNAPLVWQLFANLVLVPMLLGYALCFGTPDLLLLCLLLAYLWQLQGQTHLNGWSGATRMGATGALMYFAKGFGLPFFLAHFTLVSLIGALKGSGRGGQLRQYAGSMAVFASLAFIWMAAIHWKYGRFASSAAGSYNLSLSAPEVYGAKNRSRHPLDNEGLRPPTYPNSIAPWEDQGTYPYRKWNPLSSRADLKHYLGVLAVRNLRSIYYGFFKRQTGSVALLLLLLWALAAMFANTRKGKGGQKPPKPPPHQATADPLRLVWLCASIFAVYNLGYVLVFVIWRYLWINELVFLLLALIAATRLRNHGGWVKTVALLLLALQLGLMVKRSSKMLLFQEDADLTAQHYRAFKKSPSAFLSQNFESHHRFHQAVKTLASRRDLRGRTANHANAARRANFLTTYVAFYAGNRHYGRLTDEILKKEGLRQLYSNGIDHYYVWEHSEPNDSLAAHLPLVYKSEVLGLRIFGLEGTAPQHYTD